MPRCPYPAYLQECPMGSRDSLRIDLSLRDGDTLVVPKLDRLARSVVDVRHVGDSLSACGVRLQFGTQVYDPADPMGKMFFWDACGLR